MRSRTADQTSTRWAGGAATVLGLLLVVAVAWVVWYRSTDHGWPWQGAPSRLTWCGRDYDQSGLTVTHAQMLSLYGPVKPVFRASLVGHEQVFAPTKGWSFSTPSCPAILYVQQGTDSFTTYGILGGP